MFLTFCLFFISLLGSQLIFLLLVLSFSHAYGRRYREIFGANGAKEITTQDNPFSNFLGPKDAVNDAFEELSETERGDKDKGKRRAFQKRFSLISLPQGERKNVCEKKNPCHCDPFITCESCRCNSLK